MISQTTRNSRPLRAAMSRSMLAIRTLQKNSTDPSDFFS